MVLPFGNYCNAPVLTDDSQIEKNFVADFILTRLATEPAEKHGIKIRCEGIQRKNPRSKDVDFYVLTEKINEERGNSEYGQN